MPNRTLADYGIYPGAAPDFSTWRLPFELRPYQREAIEAWRARRHGTIVAGTGAGKSLVVVAALEELKLPTLIFVPTKVLIDQWVRVLAEAGIQAGVWFGEQKDPKFVTVTTYQSLFRSPELSRNFTFLALDEGDLSTGEVWGRILVEAADHPYVMVVTATLPTEEARRASLERAFPVVHTSTPSDLIAGGHLVPVETVPRYIELSTEDREEYDAIENRLTRLRKFLGRIPPGRIQALMHSPDQQTRSAAYAYLKGITERQAVLANVPARADALLDIARSHHGERILVFGTRVDPLADACATLTLNGYPCRLISAETRAEERRAILTGWGTQFNVLASVGTLLRGVNVPSAGIVVFLGGGTGERRLIQATGRVLRPAPGKEKATAYLVVASNTTEERLVPAFHAIFRGSSVPEADGE
ncbi:MAG: DEAD/DEAH box helicase [Thermoplasmata archaeon]